MTFGIFILLCFIAFMTGACFDELRAIRKALTLPPSQRANNNEQERQ
jgi:hypothetical protein